MTATVYVVGTGTEVGKTTVCVALLTAARARGLDVVPFKPAQSGPDTPSDTDRLLQAAGLPAATRPDVNPLTFGPALAPGLADDPSRFLAPERAPDPGPLRRAAAHLRDWPRAAAARLVLVEGAGGLHVPMPGGTWQEDWVVALATHTLVVGLAGLGTIHHTLATIASLRAAGRPPLGFVLSQPGPADASARDNPVVIAVRSGVPHLGTLGPDLRRHADEAAPVLDALLAATSPP